ncbi:MAG: AAC(3) family N-acetyltransferase [Oscillospiraceae bacterium]|nr:AAC(3) family N-acetyltransferase [Oscillospiraceae bacterium]
MHTKETLIADLQKSGINPTGTLHVHSSMKSIGECENRADTVLDAFIEFMRDGLLIFPTHTWRNVGENNNTYDPMTTPSCVGILTNIFMKRDNVIRSLHPTHSVAAIGKDARDYTSGEEQSRSPCSRNGCYGKLYDRNAQILFLGCELIRNTFIHGVEEWNKIPNRLGTEPQELFIKTEQGLLPCPQHRHYFADGDISQNYGKMEVAFIEKGAAKYVKIGNAHSILADAVKMADLVTHCLKKNPNIFADDTELPDDLWCDF